MSQLTENNATEPLRVGEILDKCFGLTNKIWRPLLPYILGMSLFSTLFQVFRSLMTEENQVVGGLTANIILFLVSFLFGLIGFYVSFLLIDLCSDTWLGKKVNFNKSFKRINLTIIFKAASVGILIIVAIGASFGLLGILYMMFSIVLPSFFIFKFLICIIAFFMLVLFFAKRSIAIHILLLEDIGIFKSIKRSAKLMTAPKSVAWYSFSHPLVRWSGIYLVVMLIAIVPNIIGGMIGEIVASFGIVGILISIPIFFCSSFVGYVITIYNSIAFVGFYYDLRVRYEGFGLLENS